MNSLSISGKNWKLKKYNQDEILYLKNTFSLDEITSKLLSIRKIKKEDINSFLNPSIKNFLPNPNNLVDMVKSTKRTVTSIIQKEKIGIFGDYDVDGATSTALLGKYFSELNLSFEIYIPDRKKEGYGPSVKSFENLIKKGVKIINVGRGSVICEKDICDLLDSGFIDSVGFDVFQEEPLSKENNLRNYKQNIFGSHNGSNTVEAVDKVSAIALEKLYKFLF